MQKKPKAYDRLSNLTYLHHNYLRSCASGWVICTTERNERDIKQTGIVRALIR